MESDSARLELGPEPIAAGPDGTKRAGRRSGGGGERQTCSSFAELQPLSQTLLISSCCRCRLPCPGATVVKPHTRRVCARACVRVMGVFLSSLFSFFVVYPALQLRCLQASPAPIVSAARVRSLQVGPERAHLKTTCLLGCSQGGSPSEVWSFLCSTRRR